nr:MAG TPA_asm: hypothetical protein [Caudoviricetes sp.]
MITSRNVRGNIYVQVEVIVIVYPYNDETMHQIGKTVSI